MPSVILHLWLVPPQPHPCANQARSRGTQQPAKALSRATQLGHFLTLGQFSFTTTWLDKLETQLCREAPWTSVHYTAHQDLHQWTADKCSTAALGGGGDGQSRRCVMFADFHGVNAPSKGDFSPQIWCCRKWNWEEIAMGRPKRTTEGRTWGRLGRKPPHRMFFGFGIATHQPKINQENVFTVKEI